MDPSEELDPQETLGIPTEEEASEEPSSDYSDVAVPDLPESTETSIKKTAYAASLRNPDNYANAIKTSSRTGIPVDTVVREPRKASEAAVREDDYSELIKQNPKYAEWLKDSDNHVLSQDDHDTMKSIEDKVNEYGFLEMAKRSLDSGLSSNVFAPISRLPALAYSIGALPQNVLVKAAGKPEWQVSAPDWMMNNPMARYYDKRANDLSVSEMSEDIIGLAASGEYKKAGRALAAQALSGSPSTLAAIGASSVGAAPAGLIAIGVMASAGKLKQNESSEADASNSAIDAILNGSLESLSEKWGTFGILEKVASGLSKKVGKAAASSVMKEFAGTILMAGTGEGVEEAWNNSAQDVVDIITGVNPGAASGMLRRALNAGIVGGFSGATMTGPGGIGLAYKRASEIQSAKRAKEFYLSMGESLEAAKLRSRLPEKQKDYVNHLTKESAVKEVSVPVERFDEYHQSKQIDPSKAALDYGIVDEYNQAIENGTDIKVPLSTWANAFVGTEHYQALADDVKFIKSDGEVTTSINESKEIQKEMESEDERIQELVKAENPSDSIIENISSQLKGLGFSKVSAETSASVYRGFRVMEERSGMEPGTLMKAYKINVSSEKSGVDKNGTPGVVLTQVEEEHRQELSTEQIGLGALQDSWMNELMKQFTELKVAEAEEKSAGPKMIFEVAPDPSDTEATRRWNGLSDTAKTRVSNKVALNLAYKLMDALGVKGHLHTNYGGFAGFTNPSFRIVLEKDTNPDSLVELARLAGYVLSQDSTTVISRAPFKGSSVSGAITIDIPEDFGIKEVRELYDKLWEIEVDGKRIVSGHTTSGGRMAILNDSGIPDKEYARIISKKIDGKYHITVDDVNYAFIGKEDYGNGKHNFQSTGYAVPKRPPLRESADNLWDEASRIISEEVTREEWIASKGEELLGGNVFWQSSRGKIQIGELGPSGSRAINIKLLKDADMSTFLHETGHLYLAVMKDIASRTGTSSSVKDDLEIIYKKFGNNSETQEKFARSFEQYLMEGKAPSEDLRGAFSRFRAWLVSIYRGIVGDGVSLTDEVRGVFDRMLATDEEISAAQKSYGFEPLFKDPKSFGMSPSESVSYEKAISESSQYAREKMDKAAYDSVMREKKRFWKERRAEKIKEAIDEIGQDRFYKVVDKLKTTELKIDPSFVPPEFLLNMDKSILSKKSGVDPEIVANISGYSSGEELISDLGTGRNLQTEAETLADIRMREQYGDIFDKSRVKEEAEKSVSGESRSSLLRKELQYMTSKKFSTFMKMVKRISKPVPRVEDVKENAKNIIARSSVGGISPSFYLRAETKMKVSAVDAISKGDFEAAFDFRKKELMNHELYLASVSAKNAVESIIEKVAKYEDSEVRSRIGLAGGEYLSQIDGIMDRFDFRPASNKTLQDRSSLVEWYEEQVDLGFNPAIPAHLLNEAYKKHYKDLRVDELVDVSNTLKNIEHLASLKNKLLKSARLRSVEAAVEECVASIEANGTLKVQDRETRLPQDEPLRAVVNYFASMTKMSTYIRQADGYKDGGSCAENILKPLDDATNNESVANEKATIELKKVFDVFTVKDIASMYKKRYIRDAKVSLSRMGSIMVAVNCGNADSRVKLTEGHGWNDSQVEAILDSLDEKDWKVACGIWKFVDGFWPETKALCERVDGFAPEKVLATPISTKFGEMPGGYFPIKYDGRLSTKAGDNIAEEMAQRTLRGFKARSTTKHGHRMARLEQARGPIRLDFGTVFEHTAEVIHDLNFYEYLIDANRIIGNQDFIKAMKDYHGDTAIGQIKDCIRDCASGAVPAQTGIEACMEWLRKGVSISGMAWSLTTSLAQPLGLTQSFVRIGPKWVAKGLSRWLGDPTKMSEVYGEICSKSPMMRLRSKTMTREINEIRSELRLRGKLSNVEGSFFWLITKCQLVADIPTWLGGYEKAMDQLSKDGEQRTPEDTESMAVFMADRAVLDAQGGGQIKDLSSAQRGGPMMKLWTNFYSFFNTTLNLTYESFGKTDFKKPTDVGLLAVDMLMLYTVPAILGNIVSELIRGSSGDDDDFIKKAARVQASYLAGTMIGVRELSSFFNGYYGYEGPAGARIFSSSIKLMKEASQGEVDEAFLKAANQVGATLFHYPGVQVQRTAGGIAALMDGNTKNPMVLWAGPSRE